MSTLGKKGGKQSSSAEGKTGTTSNENYINSILPPKEFTENGQLWIQYVARAPASRLEVINLQEELDKRL